MENIKFVITQEEQDRLDTLLEEVRHKEIKSEPVMKKKEQEVEKDGMWWAIWESLERNVEDDDWIDALMDDPKNDERGMEVIERRNKLLYD